MDTAIDYDSAVNMTFLRLDPSTLALFSNHVSKEKYKKSSLTQLEERAY